MPRTCCVPSCKGNYKSGPKVSTFSFPKEEILKNKWLSAIHRPDFVHAKYTTVSHNKFCNITINN